MYESKCTTARYGTVQYSTVHCNKYDECECEWPINYQCKVNKEKKQQTQQTQLTATVRRNSENKRNIPTDYGRGNHPANIFRIDFLDVE